MHRLLCRIRKVSRNPSSSPLFSLWSSARFNTDEWCYFLLRLGGIQEAVGVFLLEALNVGEQGENEHQDADDFTDRESHRGPPFFGKEGDY